jgi:hypothetical protein
MFGQPKAVFRQGYPLSRHNWLTWFFVGSKMDIHVAITEYLPGKSLLLCGLGGGFIGWFMLQKI